MLQCLFEKFWAVVKNAFSYEAKKPMSYIFSSFIFIFLLVGTLGGYLCYSYPFFSMFEVTAVFSMMAWLTTFFIFISSERYLVHLCQPRRNWFFTVIKTFLLVPIELISEFSRPLALTVRLTANVLVGHIISNSAYLLVVKFSTWFVLLNPILIVVECCVLVIQSYIFSRLIYFYISE